MKKLLLSSSGLFVCCGLSAADPGSLAFGGERIGIPPLSLSESVVRGDGTTRPYQFGARLPGDPAAADLPNPGPNLLPRRPLIPGPGDAGRRDRIAQISRSFGMPIIVPGNAVDYKLVIVPPNPSVDFKLIVKDPIGDTKVEPPK